MYSTVWLVTFIKANLDIIFDLDSEMLKANGEKPRCLNQKEAKRDFPYMME